MRRHFDILVVDDEPVVTRAVEKVLLAEGFSVDLACTADLAGRRVASNDYALVLCDLMLPEIDGLELIGLIHRRLPQAPVVLITGYATLDRAVRAFRLGAFDFIPKPFDTAELIGVVRRGLAFSRLDSAARQALFWGENGPDRGSIGRKGIYAFGGHGWARPEESGSVRLGLGETFAVLDEATSELTAARVGDDLLQGNCYIRIVTESGSAHRVWAPLSGRVIERNEQAFRCAGRGGWPDVCREWVVRIAPSDLEAELANLTRRWTPQRVGEEQPWSS